MANIVWIFVAIVLHVEVVLLTLMAVPWIPSSLWRLAFSSQWSQKFRANSKFYSPVVIVVLLVLFVNSLRDVRYFGSVESVITDPYEESTPSLPPSGIWGSTFTSADGKLIKAQRNFYVSGITLFAFLLLRRMVDLINRDTNEPSALVKVVDKSAEGDGRHHDVKQGTPVSRSRNRSRSRRDSSPFVDEYVDRLLFNLN